MGRVLTTTDQAGKVTTKTYEKRVLVTPCVKGGMNIASNAQNAVTFFQFSRPSGTFNVT